MSVWPSKLRLHSPLRERRGRRWVPTCETIRWREAELFRRKGTVLPGRAFLNMRSDDVSILQQLISAANGWRNTALTVGVEITMLTTQIDDQNVILEWDETNSIWNIRTA